MVESLQEIATLGSDAPTPYREFSFSSMSRRQFNLLNLKMVIPSFQQQEKVKVYGVTSQEQYDVLCKEACGMVKQHIQFPCNKYCYSDVIDISREILSYILGPTPGGKHHKILKDLYYFKNHGFDEEIAIDTGLGSCLPTFISTLMKKYSSWYLVTDSLGWYKQLAPHFPIEALNEIKGILVSNLQDTGRFVAGPIKKFEDFEQNLVKELVDNQYGYDWSRVEYQPFYIAVKNKPLLKVLTPSISDIAYPQEKVVNVKLPSVKSDTANLVAIPEHQELSKVTVTTTILHNDELVTIPGSKLQDFTVEESKSVPVKPELKTRKARKVTKPIPIVQNSNSVPLEHKIKFKHEAIYKSRSEHSQFLWESRPKDLRRDIAEKLWTTTFQRLKCDLNSVLPFHFYPYSESFEGIPSKSLQVSKVPISYKFETNQVSYDDLWVEQLESHYKAHDHHPEHWTKVMSWDATLECIADLWSSAMRLTNSYKEAWEIIFDWMSTSEQSICEIKPKFRFLNPIALLYFYSVLEKEGIQQRHFATPKTICALRKEPLSDRASKFDWMKKPQYGDYRRITKMLEYRHYFSDLCLHVRLVETITSYFSCRVLQHDEHKFNITALMAYIYQWHIKPKLPQATSDTTCSDCGNPFCQSATTGKCTTDDDLNKTFMDTLKGYATSAFNHTKDFLTTTIPDEFMSLAQSLKKQLSNMSGVVKGLMEKVQTLLKPLLNYLGIESVTDSLTLALDIVRYYVIWINTSSHVIHGICIYGIASSLGLVDKLFKAVGEFFTSEDDDDTSGVESGSESEATSSNTIVDRVKWLFEALLSVDPKIVAMPLSFIIIVFFGIRLKGQHLTNLGNDFVNSMKNVHFIGAGMLGMGKIFTMFFDSIKFCFEWVRDKLFNKLPEDAQQQADLADLIKRYTDWAIQVSILSADENGPKNISSKVMQKIVEDRFNEGLEFYRLHLDGKLPRQCAQDFPSNWRSMKMLHNCLLRAISCQNFRVTPFHLQLYGGAGVGKSTLIRTIVNDIGQKFYPDQTNLTYSQPPTEQCDGYVGQPIWIADDAQAVNDWKNILQFILFISNCPIMLMMSNLETKGTMFTSDWVISTTNNPYVDIAGIYNQSAWRRRRHFLIEVTCNQKVIDPNDGKFSMHLFNTHYPGQDSHDYPHLKFTLMDPLKHAKIGELTMPDGVKVPVTDMTYKEMLTNLWGRYNSHVYAEREYMGDSSRKIEMLKTQLKQFDKAYDSLKGRNDIWKNLFEQNFEDRFKTMPTEAGPSGASPSNFEPPKEDDNIEKSTAEMAADILNNPKVVRNYITQLSETIEEIIKSKDVDEVSWLDAICDLCDIIEIVTAAADSLEQQQKADLLKSIDTIHRMNREYRVFDGSLNRYISHRKSVQALMEHTMAKAHDGTINKKSVITYVYDLAQDARVVSIMEYYDFMQTFQEATALPSTAAQLTADNQALPGGRRACQSEIDKLNENLDRVKMRVAIWTSTNFSSELAIWYKQTNPDYCQAYDKVMKEYKNVMTDDLANDAKPGFIPKTNEYKFLSAMAEGAILMHRKTAVMSELDRLRKAHAHAARTGRDPPNSDYEPDTDDEFVDGEKYHSASYCRNAYSDYFGKSSNDVFGTPLTNKLKFGIRVTSRFNTMEQYVDNIGPIQDICDKMVFHGTNFHLTKSEWDEVFPQVPFTDGDTGLSWLYCTGLHRLRDPTTHETKWYMKYAEISRLHQTVPWNATLVHFDTYTVIGCSRRFQSSYKKWISMTTREMNCIYGLLLHHSPLINWVQSLYRQTKQRSLRFFSAIWDKISGSCSYLWTKAKEYKKPIAILALSAAIIGACTQFAQLFLPQATSFRASSIFANKGGKSSFTYNNIAQKLQHGVVRCNVNGSGFQGFKVYNRCLLVPWHAVKQIKTQPKVKFWLSVDISPGVKYGFEIDHLNITHVRGCDSAIVYSTDFPDWGDRIKYIKTRAQLDAEKMESAVIITRTVRGDLEFGECPYDHMQKGRTVTLLGSSVEIAQIGVLDSFVNVGVSGSPILVCNVNENSPTIAGFQSFREAGKSFFSVISRETLVDLISNFEIPRFNGPIYCDPEMPSEATCSIIQPHLEIVGSVPEPCRCSQSGKTEFERTIMFKYLPVKRVPAVLSASQPEACGDPAANSINKHGRDSMRAIPRMFLDQAIREISEYYKYKINKPRVLSVIEACEGDETMRHIDTNTSPGLPWVHLRTKKGKKDFIEFDEDGDLVYMDSRLVESCATFERYFKKREVPPFSMMEVMKDELRPVGKAYGLTSEQVTELYGKVHPALWPDNRICKTRTITVLPMEFTILYRRYFANFFTQLYKLANTGDEHYCIGINPESIASLLTYLRASELNTHGFDLDVQNWDGHMSPQLFRAACLVVNLVYQTEPQSEDWILRETLIDAVVSGDVQYKDMVYHKCWGNPSGFPGTGDINTLVHILISYCSWLEIMCIAKRLDLCSFEQFKRLCLDRKYGDDRFVVPAKEIEHLYNGETVSAWYAKYGWPTTNSAKDGQAGLVPLSELKFLKRVWIVDPEEPNYVRWAMEKDTIETLLTYVRRTFNPRQQFRDNLETALDFAADWGEVYFTYIKDLINRILVKHGKSPIILDFIGVQRMKRERYFHSLTPQRVINEPQPFQLKVEDIDL